MDEQLLREFLAEAEDLIEELYGDVEALRSGRAGGRERRELVGRIFRHVHTIKGTAAAAGLEATSGLAHELESLLDAVRLGRARLDDAALDAAEDAVGATAASLASVARGEAEYVPAGLVERLRGLASARVGDDANNVWDDEAEMLLGAEVARSLGEYERQRLREAVGEGARAYVVTADFDLESFDAGFRALTAALGETGEVVAAQPCVDEDAPGRVRFRIVCATTEGRASLAERAARFGARLNDDESDASGVAGAEGGGAEGEVEKASPSTSAHAALVRVPLDVLDDIIAAAHDLASDASGALDLALARAGGDEGRSELEARASQVRGRFLELEERLIGLRMVALGATLERAARAGRSVARSSGKLVEFEVEGGDVRLDRTLADRVADPLLHLLRNAVDHGIEDAEERRAAGKPERGRVRIEASGEGSRVVLRVSDDGRGVDAARVARAAEERGIVAAGARVSDEQALRLIFRAGFSTAGRASFVSGRGVGLEVVERAVEEAGGEVRVRNEPGRGTTFEMRLPTTLALLRAVLVRAGQNVYCLDAARVADASGGEALDAGARTLAWRGREIPLLSLWALLGLDAQEDDEGDASGASSKGQAAVVVALAGAGADEGGAGVRHVAVLVDSVEGRREVLVRGLGRHASRWRGVSGATELRDGTAALVLDLPRLIGA